MKARRPKSVDMHVNWRSWWLEEWKAPDGWYTWRRL